MALPNLLAMHSPILLLQLKANAQSSNAALEEVRLQLNPGGTPGVSWLDCRDRVLTLPELREIQALLAAAGQPLGRVLASHPLALVAAAALGLDTDLQQEAAEALAPPAAADGLTIHRGTLRSGDHLEVSGSLLVLGDVNPGARVSAQGDVRVWGRLRGVAHAGQSGDPNARIVALQLRPLQLRIADAVARGPEDQPPPGFCEQALLRNGAIAIEPAEPQWPLDRVNR